MIEIQDSVFFDRKSYRSYTKEGRLAVADNVIALEQVSDYLGKWLGQGFDPTEVYKVYRPLSVLADAVAKIDGIPLLATHRDDTPDNPSGIRCGAVSNARINGDKVLADLTFWDRPEIERVENGEDIELSLGYNGEFIKEAGEFNGQPYHVRFTKIHPNHLAMVREARAGHIARVNDSADAPDAATDVCETTLEDDEMSKEQIADLHKRLEALEGKILAAASGVKAFADGDDAIAEKKKEMLEDAEEGEESKKMEDAEEGDDEAKMMDSEEEEKKESKRIEDAADRIRKEIRAHARAVAEVSEVLGSQINDSVDTATLYVDALASMGVEGVSKAAAREVFLAVKAERAKAAVSPAKVARPVFDAADTQADPLLAKLAAAGRNYLKG